MLQVKTQDPASVIVKRLQKSQSNGFIQLDNLELKIFPKEIPNIAELRFDSQKWWDIVPITKLDISNNSITSIPEEIVNLNDLVSFRMQNNALESLPESLFLIQTLKSVDFTNNKLRALPPTFIKCTTLVEAIFRHNQLEILPSHFGGLTALEVLDLSENNLKTFRIAEGDLLRLKRLDLSNNQITGLESGLASLRELDYLNLSKNKITALPPNIFRELKSLKLLDLKENRLAVFEEFPQSTKLDTVILAFNQLKVVRNFGNVPNLTVLDLKNNKLDKLDPTIAQLKEMKTLDLSNNDLSDIPNEIGFMTKLVRIGLEGNALKSIRSSIRFAGTEALKKYLRERTDVSQTTAGIVQEFNKVSTVDVWDQFIKDFLVSGKELTVNGQNIPIIHDKFCNLNLTVLDLSNNNIAEVNPNLVKLVNLQKLRLNSNQITYIDGRILVQLESLEELELRNNKLTYLVDDVFTKGQRPCLIELRHIDLAQNRFEKVPLFITRLPKLRVLALAYNALTSIDSLFIPELVRLETLDVSNNKIERLSDEIIILENLQHLNCECNNISNFPTILGFMRSLKNIQVYGNPIKNIRREIVSKGSKFILEFLQSRHPVPFEPPRKEQSQSQSQMSQDKMQIEDDYSEKEVYHKVTEVNPYQMGNRGMRDKPVPQQKTAVNYQPEMYSKQTYQQEEVKNSYEPQKSSGKVEIQNEIKALDQAIAQFERELQENFNLSTANIMKKKKEINALRSRKNQLMQQL